MKLNEKSPYGKVELSFIEKLRNLKKQTIKVVSTGALIGLILFSSNAKLANAQEINLDTLSYSVSIDAGIEIATRSEISEQKEDMFVELVNPTGEQKGALLKEGYVFAGASAEEDGLHAGYEKGKPPIYASTVVSTIVDEDGKITIELVNPTEEQTKAIEKEDYNFAGGIAEDNGYHGYFEKEYVPIYASVISSKTVDEEGKTMIELVNPSEKQTKAIMEEDYIFAGGRAESDGYYALYISRVAKNVDDLDHQIVR